MIQELKIKPEYFNKVLLGEKNFEIRFNDRNYAKGDVLILKEFVDGRYTGQQVKAKVIYMLEHKDFPEGIPEGYVALGIKNI